MTLSEGEIWACANEMIRQHGEEAGLQAAMKADALLEAGAREGAAAWRLILHRINALQAPPSGAVN